MTLHILGSSSHGNCYLLESDTGTLVIEAGIKFLEVKKALNFQIGKIIGALISHRHDDHARYVGSIVTSGILVMASRSTLESKHLYGKPFTKEIKPMKGIKVSGFKIMPIPLTHSDTDGTPCDCLGFVIDHPESGRILFATDTMKLDMTIPKLNHVMIEANYSDEVIEERIESGEIPYFMRNRLLFSHMELETTKNVLLANDMSGVNEIVLLHLSYNNSDADMFKQRISEATGKPTYIAEPGMKLDFSLLPY